MMQDAGDLTNWLVANIAGATPPNNPGEAIITENLLFNEEVVNGIRDGIGAFRREEEHLLSQEIFHFHFIFRNNNEIQSRLHATVFLLKDSYLFFKKSADQDYFSEMIMNHLKTHHGEFALRFNTEKPIIEEIK